MTSLFLTMARVDDEDGNDVALADLAEPAVRFFAARSGRGGRGNAAFKTPA